MTERRPWSLLALLTLVVAAAALAIIVWYQCVLNPDIPFLPARRPAAWIVYPTAWSLNARPVADYRVYFGAGFDLPAAPQFARIRLRALRRYTLRVNGVEIGGSPAKETTSWKRAREHEIAAALKPGRNDIEVEVLRKTGPPALWLVMKSDYSTITTDARWTARAGTSAWAPIRLATTPMSHGITKASPRTVDAWRAAWRMALLWFGIASGIALTAGWWLRRQPRSTPLSDRDAVRTRSGRNLEYALFGLALISWSALCVNNLRHLPPIIGFDCTAHLDYIRYLLTHRRLPLANEGWEMYQPPLYYVLVAGLAEAGRLIRWSDTNVILPKIVSLFSGLALIVVTRGVLKVMFPDNWRARCAGLIIAAAMPMNIYMAQFASNEVLSAAIVSAALLLALTILRDNTARWPPHAFLGVLLALAILSKHTSFLAVAAVMAAIGVHAARRGIHKWRRLSAGFAVTLATVLLLAGWFGLRNWVHFRNPLIGNWDPASGQLWWQDPGYGTSSYYLRFGRFLSGPFHSCLYSFGDSIFSTVWGDGMCAGTASARFRPPWNYNLMAIGYHLALFPAGLILIGLVSALVRTLRRPQIAWVLLMGHGLLVGFAVFYMTLKLPYYAQAKGFYGVTAMTCVCALGSLGFDQLGKRLGRFRGVLWIPLIVWAVNVYASFFARPG